MGKKLQTLKGFRDFLPPEKKARDFVLERILEAFRQSGFEPLETPTLDYKENIMGKYGDEADKLVYEFVDRGGREVAMRYDQTVPTARVIAQYQNELTFPFKRYQVQNVFRADKPQKGRYREFTQCDIDIFGSSSPLADAEILATTYQAYQSVGFETIELRLNDRQILFDLLAPFSNELLTTANIIQSIDKLDKLAPDQVIEELVGKGLSKDQASKVVDIIDQAEPSGNLKEIISLVAQLGVPENVLKFSPNIARGLDYYTGMIFEIVAPGFDGGSLGGGGRYDKLIYDLAGIDIPAVGVGIGFDRTVEAAAALNIIPQSTNSAEVLVTIFDSKFLPNSLEAVKKLRQAGICAELYVDDTKIGKQLKYASRKEIPFVIVIGDEEAAKEQVALKDLVSGEQTSQSLEETVAIIKKA